MLKVGSVVELFPRKGQFFLIMGGSVFCVGLKVQTKMCLSSLSFCFGFGFRRADLSNLRAFRAACCISSTGYSLRMNCLLK